MPALNVVSTNVPVGVVAFQDAIASVAPYEEEMTGEVHEPVSYAFALPSPNGSV